ncbi:hypothetical protein EAI_02972 [Harpegnathos saltator]|uniref:Uncharacterized protein n=1 Tax=Harpegnathos saltator TaxID=610380 RepID=E2BUC7_HARSA|nr:hypothetical protein EAI_02972 [Harpegnathos saltator]
MFFSCLSPGLMLRLKINRSRKRRSSLSSLPVASGPSVRVDRREKEEGVVGPLRSYDQRRGTTSETEATDERRGTRGEKNEGEGENNKTSGAKLRNEVVEEESRRAGEKDREEIGTGGGGGCRRWRNNDAFHVPPAMGVSAACPYQVRT